jgi:hypothetical protein
VVDFDRVPESRHVLRRRSWHQSREIDAGQHLQAAEDMVITLVSTAVGLAIY